MSKKEDAMYTWRGRHYVGYLKYIITLLRVQTFKTNGATLICTGSIKIDKTGNYTWEALGTPQSDKTVQWTIHCTDKSPDCVKLPGGPVFTAASDINDGICTFISAQLSLAQTHLKNT